MSQEFSKWFVDGLFHLFIIFEYIGVIHSLKLYNIAPENGWLEYDRFLLGPGIFSGAFAVSFREKLTH